MDTKLNLELLKVQTCYTQHRFIALFGFKHSEYRNIVFEANWKMQFHYGHQSSRIGVIFSRLFLFSK